MQPTMRHQRRVYAQTRARFITVLPTGLRFDDDGPISPGCRAEITAFGDARTLYRCRKPICRSLDGVRSVTDASRQCDGCLDRKHCTPQVLVELFVDGKPYRLLLAYSSARNFLTYAARQATNKVALDAIVTRISVRDCGQWGELTFAVSRS